MFKVLGLRLCLLLIRGLCGGRGVPIIKAQHEAKPEVLQLFRFWGVRIYEWGDVSLLLLLLHLLSLVTCLLFVNLSRTALSVIV